MAPAGRVDGESSRESGRWVVPEVSYIDPARRFCDYCGRPIARKFWQVTSDDEERAYCDPAHAAAQTTYPRSP